MNKMKEVAKLLGVEIGEEFNIVDCDSVNPFTFKEQGLFDCCDDWCPEALSELIIGYSKIQKLPWKPKKGEQYYFITNSLNVCPGVGDSSQKITVGNCFKTDEQAQRVAEKLKIFFKEVDCND